MEQNHWKMTIEDREGRRQFSCYLRAFALDQSVHSEYSQTDAIYYLDMVGSQAAIKAIWAGLVTQDPRNVTIARTDSEAGIDETFFASSKDTKTNGWRYERARSLMPASIYSNAILVPKSGLYDDDSLEFVLIRYPNQDVVKTFYLFADRRLRIPIHSDWQEHLWQVAVEEKMARPIRSEGVDAYICRLDEDRLMERISSAGRRGIIQAPFTQETVSSEPMAVAAD